MGFAAAAVVGRVAIILALVLLLPSVASAQWEHDGVALCTEAGSQDVPVAATDGSGGAIVAWMDERDGMGDIYIRQVDASGITRWTSDGLALCAAARTQQYPQIVSDGVGGAIVTWSDERSACPDVYVQRVNASGMVQWEIDGVGLCLADDTQTLPAIATDGSGGAIVAWVDRRGGVDFDIYVQRVDASGVAQWPTGGVAVCTAVGHQYSPAIASDGNGGAIITWRDGRGAGNDYDIYAQRVDASGAIQWAPGGLAICAAAGLQGDQAIVSDGAGGAVITWADARGGLETDVYAQRVNPSGTALWAAGGVAVSAAAGRQESPSLAPDGSGGATVVWQDKRNGSDFDIYAQRVDGSGDALWTEGGVALCSFVGDQVGPQITSSTGSDGVVSWQDYRGGSPDVYAQKISESGVALWTADGLPVCTAVEEQGKPVIVADGSGGAIVSWADDRSGDSDIYSQKVPDQTHADVPVAGDGRGAALIHNAPNPFRNDTRITYSIQVGGRVRLQVFDVAGRSVRVLVDDYRGPGRHVEEWDGIGDKGCSVPSGTYICLLKTADRMLVSRMTLAR
jgi:hypothetical protein